MAEDECNVLFVHPRFTQGSFWNYQATCDMVGAKYPAPPLGLITIAAMLPANWTPRLIDCNTEDLLDEHFDWADIVMTGGMLPQQYHCVQVIEMCRSRGLPVVVGGPDVTSSPHLYERANFRVLGEAEGIFDDFIAAWRAGERSGTFEAEKFQADVTTTPVPRFDLLDFANYTQITVQYSRGCPFTCEFCDIIELYGRRPRTKTTEQILAELQALYDLGYRGHVDFVDDNLIGNKKAVKLFLPHLAAWLKERRYPFNLTTEASLNLADDDELLEMMRAARFFGIFIGIESPDPAVLNATRKKQNTRRDIAASVHKIYGAGILVLAGFIVGFDEESGEVGQGIIDLIEECAIPVAMAGLLYALPNTQLTRRLQAQGRLHGEHDVADADIGKADQCTSGLNFDTLRPRDEILAEYRNVVGTIYTRERYLGRLKRQVDMLDMSGPNGDTLTAGFWHDAGMFLRLVWGMTVRRPEFRRPLWSMMAYCLKRNPRAMNAMLIQLALFLHLEPFSRYVVGAIDQQIDEVRSGAWQRPELVAAE